MIQAVRIPRDLFLEKSTQAIRLPVRQIEHARQAADSLSIPNLPPLPFVSVHFQCAQPSLGLAPVRPRAVEDRSTFAQVG